MIEPHLNRCLADNPTPHGRRLLDALAKMLLFVAQVMHGHTLITHLCHLANMRASAAANCRRAPCRSHHTKNSPVARA